ncbi:MAG: SH3 domain-containing protein, partial [Proteobacteria bacterium]|nr:SH3 domain-containing protein [Pseudomonadota bacterium]
RKGPGRSYEPFFEQALPGGTEFRIVEEHGEWWKVELTNGENVWLNKDDFGTI